MNSTEIDGTIHLRGRAVGTQHDVRKRRTLINTRKTIKNRKTYKRQCRNVLCKGCGGGGSWVLKTWRGCDAHVALATPWSSTINTEFSVQTDLLSFTAGITAHDKL